MPRDRPQVLVVDDAPDTVEVLRRNLELAGYNVLTAGSLAAALDVLGRRNVDLVITDLRMPGGSGLDLVRHVRDNLRDTDVLMITGYPTVETAVSAVRHGASNYLAKPFTDEELLGAVRDAMGRLRSRRAVRQGSSRRPVFPGLVGESPPMLALYDVMDKASRSKAPVLVRGEPGTGKELVARAIHYRSAWGKGAFVPVHCGSIPPDRLAAELFGAASAAAGTRPRIEPGLIQAAHRGAVYLDAITHASLAVQERLLRWIEQGRITPVDAKRATRVDARVFGATDRDVRALARQGKFRQALIYQLGVIEIEVPPLRERGDDILVLTRAIAERVCKELQRPVPSFSDRVLAALREHGWPGNVRELATTVERLVVLSDGPRIDVPDLPSLLRFSAAKESEVSRTLEAVETEYVHRVWEASGGNQSRAAEVLGIDRKTLRAKLKRKRRS